VETIANHEISNVQKRAESHPKPRRVERRFGARLGGRNQVRAVGGKRIMWQLEEKVKRLKLQEARDEEPTKQLKVEKMMWLEQQEEVATTPSGQRMEGEVKNSQKQE